VLDIELPGMDGYEVAKQLKQDERTANIPIIMLTSHQDTAALQQGMLLGIVDFIPRIFFPRSFAGNSALPEYPG
jgi:putative two-component system response regulator